MSSLPIRWQDNCCLAWWFWKLTILPVKVQEGMERGVREGWWPSFDDKGPHPWPVVWKVGQEWPRSFKTISQILVSLGAFPSRSEAKAAGWERPIVLGEFWFKKNRPGAIHLIIEASDGESPRT